MIAADLRERQADLRRTLSEVGDVAEQCRARLARVALTTRICTIARAE